MRIVAIDPGVRNTGIVYMDETHIIRAKSLSFKDGVGIDNAALDWRCEEIWRALDFFLLQYPHDVVVVEGFTPFPGMKAARSTSHQTPWLIGYMLHGFHRQEHYYVIQTSKQVLNPRTEGNLASLKDMLISGKHVFDGQDLLTNDHLRCAFLHGLYFFKRGDACA